MYCKGKLYTTSCILLLPPFPYMRLNTGILYSNKCVETILPTF